MAFYIAIGDVWYFNCWTWTLGAQDFSSGIRNHEKHSKYSKVGGENNKLGVLLLLLSETIG